MKNKRYLEKRKFLRVKERAVVAVVDKSKPRTQDREFFTVSEDVSGKGMRIYANDGILRDSPLNLKFYFFQDPVSFRAKARVRWSKRTRSAYAAKTFFNKKDKIWWIGVQFTDIDPITQKRIMHWVKKKLSADTIGIS